MGVTNMLTLEQIKELLKQNEVLTVEAMRNQSVDSMQRLFDLAMHRSILKDTLIETLERDFTAVLKRAS